MLMIIITLMVLLMISSSLLLETFKKYYTASLFESVDHILAVTFLIFFMVLVSFSLLKAFLLW